MIYASEHYSTAMLEMLARWNGPPPGNQHFIEIRIPKGTSYEVLQADSVPDWNRPDSRSAREFGHLWYVQQRSAVLFVPSAVARPERNVIINADHPEFSTLKPGNELPVWWDRLLFSDS